MPPHSKPANSTDPLADLVDRSTVRLQNGTIFGTGFFVAPGYILTCAHVVAQRTAQRQKLLFTVKGVSYEAFLERLIPDPCPADDIFPDIALLSTSFPNATCAFLTPGYKDGDRLYSFGYSSLRPGGESLSAACEGHASYDQTSPARHLIKFKETQVLPGISGSPLLNRRTGGVCGIVKRTRKKQGDLGGLAIRIELVLESMPELAAALALAPDAHAEWTQARLRDGIGLSPFQAPVVPAYFVDRPQLAALKKELLAEGNGNSGVLAITALLGMGGIGKTTIAAAVAADLEVRGRFADGILWATLGQEPLLDRIIESWLTALGGTPNQDRKRNTDQLRTLLRDRSCLLVVDDIWEKEHGEPLFAGGEACRMLLTSRRTAVAADLGARDIELTTLSPTESLRLLEARGGRAIAPEERRHALETLKLVGFLPLAVEQVAMRMRHGTPWEDLIRALTADIARLEALEDARSRLTGASRLYASINLSVRYIHSQSPETWARFAWCGAFPDDVDLTAPQCAHLWNVDKELAGVVLEFLQDESLLALRSTLELSGKLWTAYRMHDIVLDCARKLLIAPAPAGLGLNLRDIHRSLVSRYLPAGESWAQLPDDGYIHNYLAWHLTKAEMWSELESLVTSTNQRGKNSWFEVRVSRHEPAGYIADLAIATRAVEHDLRATFAHDGEATAVSKRVRHALIRTSIFSQADQLSPMTVKAAVKFGVWTPSEALDRAKQVTEISERIPTLMSVAAGAPEPIASTALALSFEFACGLQEDRFRAYWFGYLARYLPEGLLLRAHTAIAAFTDESERQNATAWVIPRWVELGREEEAIQRAAELEPHYTADAIFRMAPLLSPHGIERAEAMTAGLQSRESERALAALALRAAETGLAAKALSLIREIPASKTLREYLPRIEAALGPAAGEQIAALGIRLEPTKAPAMPRPAADAGHIRKRLAGASEPQERVSIIQDLAENGFADEALAEAETLPPHNRRDAVQAIVGSLSAEQFKRALAMLERIGDGAAQLVALLALTPYLSPDRAEAVGTMFESAERRMELDPANGDLRTTLVMLARRDRAIARQVFRVFSRMASPEMRHHSLLHIAPWLPADRAAKIAVDFIYSETNPFEEPGLRRVLPLLPMEVRVALAAAAPKGISDAMRWNSMVEPETVELLFDLCPPEVCLEVLAGLLEPEASLRALAYGVHRVPPDAQTAVMNDIRARIDRKKSWVDLAILFAGGAESLPESLLEIAIRNLTAAHAREIRKYAPRLARDGRLEEVRRLRSLAEGDSFYVDYLVGVSPFFPEPERSDLIADALRAAASVRNATFARSNYFRFLDILEAASSAVALAPARLLDALLEIIPLLESHRREEFLYDLAGIAPLLAQLGGKRAMQNVADDIALVIQWWP